MRVVIVLPRMPGGPDVLELRDILSVGVRGGTGVSEGLSALVDRRGFDQVELASGGDLRFLAGTAAAGTQLYIPGDLTLAAAQVYPGTVAVAIIHAGWQGASASYDPERRLVIARATDNTPAMPYSAFGSLTLGAATVDQGGILRAPLGAINIGYTAANQLTHAINLLPGSSTSVSAGGLLMPYGGTVDGQTWQYDGETVSLYAVGGTQGDSVNAARTLKVGMTLLGESVDIQQGATVDLSGGGELLGAAFVSGRGGSTDARFNPLVQNGANGFTLPGLATNPVYAIVPGVQPVAAPAGGEAGASDSLLGQQVTIGAGVPGLAAGTYTLMPSTYALLPGAYRVELNGLTGQGAVTPAHALRNGSWSASGVLSVAGAGIRDSMASRLILTPADVLRSYSQYNEMSYADFVQADAARQGIPRGMLEADAKTLELSLRNNPNGEVSFRFDGNVLGEAAEGGFGSTVSVAVPNNSRIELLADGGQAADGYISMHASDLSAMDVNRLVIGGRPVVLYGQGGNYVDFGSAVNSPAAAIVLRSGAELTAPEVMLVSQQSHTNPSGIEVEQGASISTLGQGAAAYDSDDGFIYQAGNKSVLAVSNGRLQWLAPEGDQFVGPGSILVGTCTVGGCAGETQLYSEGSIAFATDNTFELDDAVRYGTRHLTLAVGAFNIGSAQALFDAGGRGALPSGLTLNQQLVERLLQGDTRTGAPALEILELIAGDSMNFFESVNLSTLDAQGQSLLDNLLLTTMQATIKAAKDERHGGKLRRRELPDTWLDIQVLHTPRRVETTDLQQLKQDIELGVHAIRMEKAGGTAYCRSTVPITKKMALKGALKSMGKKVGASGDVWELPGISLTRYETIHISERLGNGDTASETDLLFRNTPIIRQSQITRSALENALWHAGTYMSNHTTEKGKLTYEFDPRTGERTYSDSAVGVIRRMASTWIMAEIGHYFNESRFINAARRSANRLISQFYQPVPEEGFGIINVKGKANVGTAGFVLLVALASMVLPLPMRMGSLEAFIEGTRARYAEALQRLAGISVDYLIRLESDRYEYAQLINTLLINVTEFFRDAAAYRKLAEAIDESLFSEDATEVRFNSHWLRPLNFEDVVRLTSHYTVARLLERDEQQVAVLDPRARRPGAEQGLLP